MEISQDELVEAFKVATAELFVLRMQRDLALQELAAIKAEIASATAKAEEVAE